MANEPKSPIAALAERLAQQPSLKSNGVPVYPWRTTQAKNTDARRIVIFPTKGGLTPSTNVSSALCDVEQTLIAECWGKTGDATWAILSWLIQALESQAIGKDGDPGYAYTLLGSDWSTSDDSSTQGEVVGVLFEIRLQIPAVDGDVGHLGAWRTGQIDSATQDIPASREVTDG